jgi:tRNA A-37 threonylcarbamoyl transferase component Bud32
MLDVASWPQLKDVVAEAVKRAPSEREAFVRSHFPDPEESTTVLSLLAGVDDSPPAGGFERSSGATIDPGVSVEPGTSIGPYVVVDRIGHGGMGEVFLGSDPRLRRRVALKCLTGSVPHDLRREQILHEARAAASISHPNVAAIYDVIEKDDRMFIVMEYVQGETLAARLKRERLPIAGAIAIGRQLASALAAAHRQGVVHRDLKPANVQMTPQGTVKVLDFGIANAAHSLTTAGTASTRFAVAFPSTPVRSSQPGTPPYMSPEQLLNRNIDQRSDLFSLGVVLFEMVTGRRPFPGSNAVSIAIALADGAPRADAVDRSVPGAVADIIARALQLDPALRYQTATEIGDALDVTAQSLAPKRRHLSETIRVAARRSAVGVPIATAALALVGFVATMGFNTTFGRDGGNARFGVEPWPAYLIWGARAMFPSLVIMTLAAVAALAARFVFSLLVAFQPFRSLYDRVRRPIERAIASAGLHDPATLAQALCVLGAVAIVAVTTVHLDLVTAWTALFNTSDIDRLWPMRESTRQRLYYHVELDVATLACTYGLVRVMRMRGGHGSRSGGSIAMLAGVIVVMVLLNEWPYRTFSHRDFERVEYAGARCYITGQSGDELLILCPSHPPPRNRVVKATDPAVQRTGIVENVFRGVPPPAGGR